MNDYVKNKGAAPSTTANGSNEVPVEAVDENVSNVVTAAMEFNEVEEAFGAMVDSEGDYNVVDMLKAAGMNRPNRDQDIIRPWEMYPVPSLYDDVSDA